MCSNIYDNVTDFEVCGLFKNTENLNICKWAKNVYKLWPRANPTYFEFKFVM